MPVHPFEAPRGRLESFNVESRAVAGNLLGDPSRRRVVLYLPEEHDRSASALPLFVALAGFTGSGPKQVAWRSFGENVPQRIDRLVATEKMGPVVVAFPDCFTSLGGNQYVNSAAMGMWEDFLLEELVPEIERRFNVSSGPGRRALFGKSSGGYGALVHALKHGEHWAAAACHSGDIGFDWAYRRDLPLLLDVLAAHDGIEGFIGHLRAALEIRGREMHALMLLAMAASYDPDPRSPRGIRLPLDPHTAEIDAERWGRWLEHDPLQMLERPECQGSLRRLEGLFIDCGRRDQYYLHYGARCFTRRLEALGIEHRYEEFDDDHSGIDYRLDVSLPFLFQAVEASEG